MTEVKSTPRAHCELIKRWSEDDSLKAYVWTNQSWFYMPEPTWLPSDIYAVAKEKPTAQPTREYQITISPDHSFITLPSDLTKEELEARIRKIVMESVKYFYDDVTDDPT